MADESLIESVLLLNQSVAQLTTEMRGLREYLALLSGQYIDTLPPMDLEPTHAAPAHESTLRHHLAVMATELSGLDVNAYRKLLQRYGVGSVSDILSADLEEFYTLAYKLREALRNG